MKQIRKAVAAALAVLTMITVSVPAAAERKKPIGSEPAVIRTQCAEPNDCKNVYSKLYCLIFRIGCQCAVPQESAVPDPTDASPMPVQTPTQAPESAPIQAPDVTAPTEAPETSDDNAALSAYERAVVDLTNRYREQYGLAPLTADPKLCELARMKSQDMRDKGYFDHHSPTYGSPFEMMKRFGVSYRTTGENIAMGYRTAQSVVEGWMNSPGHRANILNAGFTRIGVGYISDGNYCTQMFIG